MFDTRSIRRGRKMASHLHPLESSSWCCLSLFQLATTSCNLIIMMCVSHVVIFSSLFSPSLKLFLLCPIFNHHYSWLLWSKNKKWCKWWNMMFWSLVVMIIILVPNHDHHCMNDDCCCNHYITSHQPEEIRKPWRKNSIGTRSLKLDLLRTGITGLVSFTPLWLLSWLYCILLFLASNNDDDEDEKKVIIQMLVMMMNLINSFLSLLSYSNFMYSSLFHALTTMTNGSNLGPHLFFPLLNEKIPEKWEEEERICQVFT